VVRSAHAADLIEELWVTEEWNNEFPADVIASESVMRAAGETDHPQGVLAICRQPKSDLDAMWSAPGPIVYLDRISDPGNLGTIIRTAAAVGAAGVALSPQSVDPFNGKVVRSSAGAVCSMPVAVNLSDPMSRTGRRFLATAPAGGASLFEADLSGPVCWLIGSEAHGLDPQLQSGADAIVTIPMAPGTESLNAAVATAVCLFTAFRDTPPA